MQDRRYKPVNPPPDTYAQAVARARRERAELNDARRHPLPEPLDHDEF